MITGSAASAVSPMLLVTCTATTYSPSVPLARLLDTSRIESEISPSSTSCAVSRLLSATELLGANTSGSLRAKRGGV